MNPIYNWSVAEIEYVFAKEGEVEPNSAQYVLCAYNLCWTSWFWVVFCIIYVSSKWYMSCKYFGVMVHRWLILLLLPHPGPR